MGHVQVQLQADTTIVKARVTPEHKVKQAPYGVTVEMDTVSGDIKVARCHGCQARNGGCKHVAALVLWLHRRSSDPSVTEVTCYWRKARLSNVANLSPIKAKSLGSGKNRKGDVRDVKRQNFLQSCLEHAKETGLQPRGAIFKMVGGQGSSDVDIHQAYMDELCIGLTAGDVMAGELEDKLSEALVQSICELTAAQSVSPQWHHLRYGRITASKVYEVAQCRTVHGSLVETILGAKKFKGTDATRRGLELEPLVLNKLASVRGILPQRTGLHILRAKPMFAASPDALVTTGDQLYVIEVKCPVASKTVDQYVTAQGVITTKVRAQLQLQILAAGARKGILYVADPAFESSGAITIVDDNLDMDFIQPILERAEHFWVHAILPMILK